MKTFLFFSLTMLFVMSAFAQNSIEFPVDSNQHPILLAATDDNYAVRARIEEEGLASTVVNEYVVTKDSKFGPYHQIEYIGNSSYYNFRCRFAPDGKSLAFIASVKYNSNVLVKNNQQFGPFEQILGFEFSPDSKSVAYTTRKGNDYYVYMDDELLGIYSEVSRLQFAGNNTLCYAVRTKDNKTYIVIGKERHNIPPSELNYLAYADRIHIAITKDAQNWAALYDIVDEVTSNGSIMTTHVYLVARNRNEGIIGKPSYYRQYSNPIQFSPNGKILAYMSELDGKGFFLNAGSETIPNVENFCFTPDSKKLAYTKRLSPTDGGRLEIYVGSKQIGLPINGTFNAMQFSQDGNTLIFTKDHSTEGYFINIKKNELQSIYGDPSWSINGISVCFAYKFGFCIGYAKYQNGQVIITKF